MWNNLGQRDKPPLAYIDAEQYRRALFSDAKYREGNRLEPYGFKVYSQCDEDGIIQ